MSRKHYPIWIVFPLLWSFGARGLVAAEMQTAEAAQVRNASHSNTMPSRQIASGDFLSAFDRIEQNAKAESYNDARELKLFACVYRIAAYETFRHDSAAYRARVQASIELVNSYLASKRSTAEKTLAKRWFRESSQSPMALASIPQFDAKNLAAISESTTELPSETASGDSLAGKSTSEVTPVSDGNFGRGFLSAMTKGIVGSYRPAGFRPSAITSVPFVRSLNEQDSDASTVPETSESLVLPDPTINE